jgi:hypothetical protein
MLVYFNFELITRSNIAISFISFNILSYDKKAHPFPRTSNLQLPSNHDINLTLTWASILIHLRLPNDEHATDRNIVHSRIAKLHVKATNHTSEREIHLYMCQSTRNTLVV